MKVVAFNGSPRAHGNTREAIGIMAEELEKNGIEVEVIQVGNKKIRGCLGCMWCVKAQNERCVIDEDEVNEYIQKMKEADGIILSSPVYYSGVAGTMKSFLDRAFFVVGVNGNFLRHRVGTSLAAVRRSGGIPTIDNLDRYINYSEMFVPTSNYWNVAHGLKPGEVAQDDEGVQIIRILGKNMAWLMKAVEIGKKELPLPEQERKRFTNFIR
jgi:multimeric flavodoxin WrbA